MSEVIAEKQEDIQSQSNPETIQDLKPKMQLMGKVVRLELYGAFIDLGIGVNALIHISKLGKDQVNRVADILNVGDEVKVWVENVDPEKNQVMVSMIEPLAVDWKDLKEGQSYSGTVTRLETYGAFVDIGAEREGLVHISELSHDFIKHPSEVLSVGAEVNAKVLGFSKKKKRIDLSIKALQEKPEAEVFEQATMPEDDEFEDEAQVLTAMEFAFSQAMGDDAPMRLKKKKESKKSRKRSKMRRQQDDILKRTLNN